MTYPSAFILDNWHPISALGDVPTTRGGHILLLDVPVDFGRDGRGAILVTRTDTGAMLLIL